MNLLNQLLFSALEYASFIYLFASALSILLPAWGGSGGGGGGGCSHNTQVHDDALP